MSFNVSLREIRIYSKFVVESNFLNLSSEEQKTFITDKLKTVDWYNDKRINYNTWLYYKYNDYNPELIIKKKKYYIILNKIQIRIRIQDYFFLTFMNELIKQKYIKKWLIDGYLLEDQIYVECNIKTNQNKKMY